MKTYSTKPKDITRAWHLLDAKGQILGRFATKVAQLLMGKSKPYFTSYLDCGDYVVVINSDKIEVTGKKSTQKTYYHHSNYPGGLKSITFAKQLAKDSRKIIEMAVKRMLPQNKLRDPRLRRLKVFPDATHPHQSQLKPHAKKD